MNDKIKHLAIIMDGNGRWAQSRQLKRTDGHLAGTENVRTIALAANRLDIEVLTVYAFSTENWRRPMDEVSFLMKLPALFFDKYLPELMDNNIKITMMGTFKKVPSSTQKVLKNAIETTKNNTGMVLNFAFNYGGRQEIVQAVNQIIKAYEGKKIPKITEEQFESYLYTSHLLDVDLMIRTSGEQRISNFMLWQLSYAEMCFFDKSWPEFTEADLIEIINDFKKRQRRFGGL